MVSRLRGDLTGVLAVATGAVLGSALLTAGCGFSSSSEVSERVAPAQLGKGTVAIVEDIPPELGVIRQEEFEVEMEIAAAAEELEQLPQPGSRRYGKLRDAAMEELLDAAWLRGQAAEMGIEVTKREIAAELRSIESESFKAPGAYQRFLRESRMTQEMVEARVELQLLSQRIQGRVPGGQEGFGDFVSRYQERWRSRTLCAPEYRTAQCSNGPTP